MIIETFRQAIQNVWSNKLRTFLTMLGIIIGVMAVIVIVGLGNGMTKSMRDSFSALGTNTLSVQVWGNGSRTVSVEEMYKLPTEYPELIQSISPQIDFSGSGTLKIGTTSYRWSNISGVDENYSAMKNYQIAQGRGLQYMDMKDNKHVCVIGDYLNRVAFGGNGLGQTLKIGANKFRIVGVLSAKVSDPDMQQGSDDDCVYLPYTTGKLIPLDVIYSNNRPSLFDNDGLTNSDTTGTNACLVKAKVWEYEQEVRVIKKKKSGIYSFDRKQMTGIYFGMKINKQDKKIISQLVDDSNKYTNTKIKKHDVQIAFNTFELFKIPFSV